MASPHPLLLALASGRSIPDTSHQDELVWTAFEHHLFGLLWTEVLENRVTVPRHLEDRLAVQDLLTKDRHERLWKIIGFLDGQLRGLGAEFAVIKGVPTEARWYRRLGERPCADIDVFLSPEAVPRIEEIVRRLDPSGSVPERIAERYERGLLYTVDLKIDDVAVDVHLDPLKVGLLGRDGRALWAHTVPFETPDGATIRVLDAEATLFHLLVAMNRDAFFRLLGFADVARILRGPIDWDSFRALARSYGLEAVSFSSVAAVVETLDLDVAVPRPRGIRSAVWRTLWRPAVRLQGDDGWTRYRHRNRWLPALAQGRFGDAVRWWAYKLPETNPEERGPWPWRLAVGRLKRRRARARSEEPLAAGDGLTRRR